MSAVGLTGRSPATRRSPSHLAPDDRPADGTDDPASDDSGAAALDWAAAGYLLLTVTAVLVVVDPRLRHWFVVPVTACGVLLGGDVVGWLRGRFDVFHPQALLSMLGLHFFYAAPILHVVLDYWAAEVLPPADWRDALGAMAALNAAGLGVYRWVVSHRRGRRGRSAVRQVDERRLYRVGLLVVACGVSALAVEVYLFGGLDGLLFALTEDRGRFAGLGWLVILAESFPLVVFMLALVRWRAVLATRPRAVAALLVALAVAQFLVGGLRGSRSSTVWPIVIGLILVHLLVVRISRRTLLGCGLLLIVFMYLYGFYKDAGAEVVGVVRGETSMAEISSRSGRDLRTVILGDLGRSDIQALVLERQRGTDAELGYGVTYLGAVASLVPRAVVPERPTSKAELGTHVLRGPGHYDVERRRGLQRVYGLTGEAMLNFGPPAAVVAFLALGLAVRWLRRLYERAVDGPELAPRLLVPALCVALAGVLVGDLDNTLFFLAQRSPLLLVVLLAVPVGRPGPARPVQVPAYPRAARSPGAHRADRPRAGGVPLGQ